MPVGRAREPPEVASPVPLLPANLLVILICILGTAILVLPQFVGQTPPETRWGDLLFLGIWVVILNRSSTRLDRGTLNTAGIASRSAGLLLTPLGAAAVGLVLGLETYRLSKRFYLTQLAGLPLWTCLPSAARIAFHLGNEQNIGAVAAVVFLNTFGNWVIIGFHLAVLEGVSIVSIWRRSFTSTVYFAFAYLGLAGALVANLLDGTTRGYVLASIVFVLSPAITGLVSGRRIRSFLEEQLTDADHHLIFSRAIQTVVHNVRNHIALADAHLQELADVYEEPPTSNHLRFAQDGLTPKNGSI